MLKRIIVALMTIIIPVAGLVFFIQRARAAEPLIGCTPYTLTVKTGQTFYITVAVTDTIDLYAWQLDASFYPAYLEYVNMVSGDYLRSDGAANYTVQPVLVAGSTLSELTLAANTRLSKDSGIDGSGKVVYLIFRAVKQKLDGSNITLNDVKMVDRNAILITKSLANSGVCKIYISDAAPPLIQPPIEPVENAFIYLPLVLR